MSETPPPETPPASIPALVEQARESGQSLEPQLACFNDMIQDKLPAVWQAYDTFTAHLADLEVGANAPRPGDPLPPFMLPSDDGELVASANLLAEGPLVVSFNRGNWCPYCWLELTALQACLPEIQAAGARLVSITPEVATFSRQLKSQLGLGFPILTDLDNGYATELGLAFAVSRDIRGLLEKGKIDLGVFQRNDGWFLPVPAVLVAGRDGIIRHSYVNADFRQRFDPKILGEVLAGL